MLDCCAEHKRYRSHVPSGLPYPAIGAETRDGIEPPTHALDWNEIAAEITNMICVFISLLYHLSYLAMWHVLLICKDVCAIALIGESWI